VYQDIRLEIADPAATITLNRPEKLNAFTLRMMQELPHAFAVAERSPEVVGIVVTGAGRGFCAGMDMTELATIQQAGSGAIRVDTDLDGAAPGDSTMGSDFAEGFGYLMTLRKPVIAAINGPCVGAGFALAMFCDLRFAAEDAILTTGLAARGLVAELGMSWVLPRLIGPARALDILFSARRIEGREAVELGLVNHVLPAGELLPAAVAYVRQLAASCAPSSLAVMKRQVYRHLMQSLGPAAQETNVHVRESMKAPAIKEGIDSFRERRPPAFPRVSG
jgi:enoyl-CoA hydratase/carnithine racemase